MAHCCIVHVRGRTLCAFLGWSQQTFWRKILLYCSIGRKSTDCNLSCCCRLQCPLGYSHRQNWLQEILHYSLHVHLHIGAIHLFGISSMRRRRLAGKRSNCRTGLHRFGLLPLWKLHFTLHSLSRQEKDNWNSFRHNANDLKHRPRLLPSHQWLADPKKWIQGFITLLCPDRRARNTDFDLPFIHS